jgi:hypothetical protein
MGYCNARDIVKLMDAKEEDKKDLQVREICGICILKQKYSPDLYEHYEGN